MSVDPRPRGRPRKPPSAMAAAPLPRAGLHEQAAARLKHMIVQGEIPPGSPLGEAELSGALSISRTPLREALKLLAAEGLVELRPNRTARVPDWEPAEVRDLFEALAGIERLGAELAAERITEKALDELRAMQVALDGHFRRGELGAYFSLNQDIHRFVVTAARNRALADLHRSLLGRAQWARLRALSARGRWQESAEEHRLLLTALESRDAARAGEVARDHVLRTGEVIAEVLREARADPDRRSAA